MIIASGLKKKLKNKKLSSLLLNACLIADRSDGEGFQLVQHIGQAATVTLGFRLILIEEFTARDGKGLGSCFCRRRRRLAGRRIGPNWDFPLLVLGTVAG